MEGRLKKLANNVKHTLYKYVFETLRLRMQLLQAGPSYIW